MRHYVLDGTATSSGESNHVADHVVSAVRIWHSHSTLGIVLPLAVHNEAVVMRARCKLHLCAPHTARFPCQVHRLLQPMGEISHQLDRYGRGRPECEDLARCGSLLEFGFLCHGIVQFRRSDRLLMMHPALVFDCTAYEVEPRAGFSVAHQQSRPLPDFNTPFRRVDNFSNQQFQLMRRRLFLPL